MKIAMRVVGITLLLLLFTVPTVAQDDNTITVTGSRIVTQILENAATDDTVALNPSGTTSGFEAFCQGEVAATGATRPISIDEEALCNQNDITYVELLLGYDVAVFIAHPELTFFECLAPGNLNTIFAPSAQDIITNWNQTGIEGADEDIPLGLYVPQDDTTTFVLLDDLVDGIGIRDDVTTQPDTAAIVESVRSTPGALGVVKLSDLNEDSGVKIVQLSNDQLGECFTPTAETIENRQYPAANRLLLYVNADNLDALNDLVSAVANSDEYTTAAGYTAPTQAVYDINQAILSGEEDAGRQFTQEITAFQIPQSVFGTVSISGSAYLIDYIQATTGRFNAAYPSVTFSTALEGEPDGLRQLCNGEVDIITTTGELPEAEAQNCEANNVTTYTLDLGYQPVVLVANAEDAFLECLTTDQVITIWGTASTETITNWSDVSSDFPDLALSLVAPPLGTEKYTDLLLRPAEGPIIPQREDVAEADDDVLYRAAAVANVPGALTYMSWQQYQDVLASEQQGIQLVSIDAGNGCVMPSETTIAEGSYPYISNGRLVANLRALARSEVQSYLWFLLEDENYTLLVDNNLVGFEFGELPTLRGELETTFSDAIALASTPVEPEVTAEPEAEAAPEAEATDEATGE